MAMAGKESMTSQSLLESWLKEKVTLEELQKYVQEVDMSKLAIKLNMDIKEPHTLSDICALWITRHDPTNGDVEKILLTDFGISISDQFKSEISLRNDSPVFTDTATGQPEVTEPLLVKQGNVATNQATYSKDSISSSISELNGTQGLQYYGIGDITKPIGVSVRYREYGNSLPNLTLQDDISFNYMSTCDLIKDQSIKVKVRPMLVSFSGLPESGMSNTLEAFLSQHVEECPPPVSNYIPITSKNEKPKAQGIMQYDLIADGSDPLAKFTISEAMKESFFTFGVLTAFKNVFNTQGKVPVLDSTVERQRYFEDNDLENFSMHMYQFLCNQPTIPNSKNESEPKAMAASGLVQSLPDCLTLINIWDHSIKNTVRHLLSALQGHLYNHYMFLFLDLNRDLHNLDKPLEIHDIDRDGAVFMKWRPRLHYLLHSAWATEEKGKERRRTCTLFAKSDRPYSNEVKADADKLEDYIKPVGKHIGVSKLLDKKIEVVSIKSEQKPFYSKMQHIASIKPPDEIPLSWLFLRSSFYHSDKVIVSKKELQEKAIQCGMDDKSLSEFCKFYTSFGSIIDLSLANPDPEHKFVITKPVRFLNLLNDFLFPDIGTFEKYPTIELGIIPEKYCKESFGDNWSNIMDALLSLELATKAPGGLLKLPSSYSIDQTDMHFYISLCCQGDPITDVNPDAIHLITNIDTPHFFKQVTVARQLLKSQPLRAKMYPCTNVNQIIIKASDTIVTFTFHSPVIKIHMNQYNSTVCSHIVQAFNEIVATAHEANGVKVKYKFVTMCADAQREEIPNVQSLLSSRYHVLPYYCSCQSCSSANKDNELLNIWNEALEKNPIPSSFKPTGDIDSQELFHIIEKMGPNLIDPKIFAETFIPNYRNILQFRHLAGDRLMNDVLFSWYENIRHIKNGGPEPRRALAEKLSELGDRISISHGEPQKMKLMFEKLAKRIDTYWKFKTIDEEGKDQDQLEEKEKQAILEQVNQLNESLCEKNEKLKIYKNVIMELIQSNKNLSQDDIPKLALVLKPVEDDWYELGESLGINVSLLDEIKNKREEGSSASLQSLLQLLYDKNKLETKIETSPDMIPLVAKKPTVDQGLQFDYLIPLMDKLECLSDVHIAGKKLFQIQGDIAQLMNWEQYGLRIGVSKESLLHSETVEAAVVALVGGQFVFPENTKLVSAVYAISTTKPLLRPMRLEMQHCLNLIQEAQTESLKFAIAPINTPSLPYVFTLIEGGQFTVGEWYGTIYRKEFCLVCIVEQVSDKAEEDMEEEEEEEEEEGASDDSDEESDVSKSRTESSSSQYQAEQEGQTEHKDSEPNLKEKIISKEKKKQGVAYTGLVYYEEKGVEDLVTFAATKKLNALIQYIKKEHSRAEIRQNMIFYIKPAHDFIELIFDSKCQPDTITGWDVRPLTLPARLHRDTIENFGGTDYPLPPKSVISVYGSPTAVPILNYAVTFKGVTESMTIIIHTARKEQPLQLIPVSDATRRSSVSTEQNQVPVTYREGGRGTVDVRSVKKKIEQVLFDNQVALTGALQISLPTLANELLEAHIITRELRGAPSYDKIIESFLAGINLKRTLPSVEAHCTKFLSALSNVGGPVADAAGLIQEEWIEIMKNDLGIELKLHD